MRKSKLPAVALAASLLAGGTAGALLFTPISALAQESTDAARSPVGWIADALKKLVDDGTITQQQSDAVAQALEEAKPAHGPRGGGGGGRMSLDAAAEALGIGGTELRDELAAGKTIAEVAAEQSVGVQAVIDAMVADFRAHLAEHVANGSLTQEQADAKADAVERFTTLVNDDFPLRGHGRGGPGRMGPPPADSPATPSA